MQVLLITSQQIKAARAALGWSIMHVSALSGIGSATLKRYEVSIGVPRSRKGHLETLRQTFEAAGIEFIGTPDDGPGLRIRPPKPDAL